MLAGVPLVGLTAPALLGVTVLLLLTGKIVPRTTLTDKIREAAQWREAYEKEREARALTDAQTVQLLELAKTTNAFIGSVFRNSEHIRQTRGPDVPN